MTLPPPHNTPSIQSCTETQFRNLLQKTDPRHHPALFRIRACKDPLLFATLALPEQMRLPPARFHHRLFHWHRLMTEEPLPGRTGLRFAVAAPRGSAKSTIVSFALLLHDIAFAHERYVLLISATQHQAEQRLRALRTELLRPTRINQWFAPAFHPSRVRATNRSIDANTVRIEAFGAGAEMRGVTYDSWRPTKIILDDAEASDAAQSPRRRAQLLEWFHEVVEHLGDSYTHLLAIGTVLHPESLLASLIARPDFQTLFCRSVERFAPPSPLWTQWRALLTDAASPGSRQQARHLFLQHREEMERGTQVLWPEHEDYEQLYAQLILQGRRAFFQEKQNEPLGAEDALFQPAEYRLAQWTGEGILINRPSAPPKKLPAAPLRWFGYLDSALGKRTTPRGDFAAFASVAAEPGGRLLLLEIWIRRATPSRQLDVLLKAAHRRNYHAIGIEGTAFQELLARHLDEERRKRPVNPALGFRIDIDRPKRAKESRIALLEPLLASGRLILGEDLPEEFWRELHDYPRVPHDDALDAAAGAVQLALRAARRSPVSRIPPPQTPRPRPARGF